jgi:LysR family transcriptional regulator, carnitine catabolism transcriptional activator
MISLLGLRTLAAVVETGSIRAAANRLSRTPSAVSMMLKQLEGEVGGALFAGERKNLLSELGLRVHAEAKVLLEHYARASAAMTSFAENRIGRCDVACVPSVAANFLPEAIAKARCRIGSFSIQVRDMDSQSVIEAVEDRSVEVGFCVISHQRPGLAFEPLFRERLDFVCRRDHRLGGAEKPVSWDEIDPAEFIANGSAATISSDPARTIVNHSLLRARNVTSILAMVQAGLGVTVLPRLCRHQSSPEVVFLPLDDEMAERMLGWIRTDERALLPATHHLIAELKQVIDRRSVDLDYVVLSEGNEGVGQRGSNGRLAHEQIVITTDRHARRRLLQR